MKSSLQNVRKELESLRDNKEAVYNELLEFENGIMQKDQEGENVEP